MGTRWCCETSSSSSQLIPTLPPPTAEGSPQEKPTVGANRCCESHAASVPSSHRLQKLHLSNFWRTQGSIWGDKSPREMCWDLLWDGSARSFCSCSSSGLILEHFHRSCLPPRALLGLPRTWDQGRARMWSLSWGSQGLPRMGLKNILILWPWSKEAPGNGVLRLRQVWRSWGFGSRT